MERRWTWLAPPVAGVLALGVLASGSIGAADAPWNPPPCAAEADEHLAAAVTAPSTRARWFTLDDRVAPDGSLEGLRLRIGTGAERSRYVDVPAESSAAGPFGTVVLVVADDGRQSVIMAYDREAGCAIRISDTADVVRRVTLDALGAAVYEHRVDRRSRADLGVWRRPLDGREPALVLPPVERDQRFGRTWATSLAWSTDGELLAATSCGALACRVRVQDVGNGEALLLDDPTLGELIGVADGWVVRYAACGGAPCRIVATDLSTRQTSTIVADAALARFVRDANGTRLAAETHPGVVELWSLDGRLEQTVELPDTDQRLVPSGDRAAAGVTVPDGWLPTARDGRSPDQAVLTRLLDGRTVGPWEVLP